MWHSGAVSCSSACRDSFIYMCLIHIYVSWLIHMCDVTHSYVYLDSFIYSTWFIHVWHDSPMHGLWLIYMCVLTNFLYGRRDSRIGHSAEVVLVCAVTHSYMWALTHSRVWRDSFVCVPWLIHMCDMTLSYAWYDSFICVTWLIHIYICVCWLIHMCDVTHA